MGFSKTLMNACVDIYALILSQRYRNDSTSSESSSNDSYKRSRGSCHNRAGGDWEYEDTNRREIQSSRRTSSSSYPVVPTSNTSINDEFRPKKETEIRRVGKNCNVNLSLKR